VLQAIPVIAILQDKMWLSDHKRDIVVRAYEIRMIGLNLRVPALPTAGDCSAEEVDLRDQRCAVARPYRGRLALHGE
jgi:hypothetical protein